jgi:flagellar protein FlgJ
MSNPLASPLAGPLASGSAGGSAKAAASPAAPSPAAPSPAAMKRAAEEFEAVFLAQFLGSLTAGLGADGPTEGGSGQEVFKDMMNQEMAKLISRTGGIGVADTVLQEMLKMQEVA